MKIPFQCESRICLCLYYPGHQTDSRGTGKSSDSERHSPAYPEKLLRNLLKYIYTTLGVLQPLPTHLPERLSCVPGSWYTCTELLHSPAPVTQRLLAQALDTISQVSTRTLRDCSAGSCCLNVFIPCHINVCSSHLSHWR